MPATTTTTSARSRSGITGREAVQPGDADVLVHRHVGAEQLRSDPGLVHHRPVGRAGRHDQHPTAPLERVALHPDRAGELVLERVGQRVADGRAHLRIGPRDQDARGAGLGERPRDRGGLLGRLAGPEDHLRRALAELTMGVDSGEAQVAVRQLGDPIGRGLRRHIVVGDGLEELFQAMPGGHAAESTRPPPLGFASDHWNVADSSWLTPRAPAGSSRHAVTEDRPPPEPARRA